MRYRAYYRDWSSAGVRSERDIRRLIDSGRACLVPITQAPRDDLRADMGAAFSMGISAEMILYIDEFPKSEDAAVRYALGCIRYDGRRDGIAFALSEADLANRGNPEAVHARTGRPVGVPLPKLHRTDTERREAEAVAGGRLVAQPRGV